jgi:hypothetical protein
VLVRSTTTPQQENEEDESDRNSQRKFDVGSLRSFDGFFHEKAVSRTIGHANCRFQQN